MNDLIQKILSGDKRAASRLMRFLDDGHPLAWELLTQLYPHSNRAQIIGITGNPGSGKSTLTNQFTKYLRSLDKKVGVIAIDPSSTFTGGAILGDRIRMNSHANDDGVFIRSIATRNHLGGLSRSTDGAVIIMDAMGYDIIIIETVGVGQDEIDISRMAHTTVVVFVPGLGDEIQAFKAGIIEIADMFVINKADRPGADEVINHLQMLLLTGQTDEKSFPPIVKTIATDSDNKKNGISELYQSFIKHQQFLVDSGLIQKKYYHRIDSLIKQHLAQKFSETLESYFEKHSKDSLVNEVIQKKLNPFSVAQCIANDILR